ncbi:hypothetical protein FRZ61_09050 [Hypericibacter adhaerens]|uniref:Uncharacterized protein n=1 Tax=Hypericibacter adhaerens TaxID=2602016 RepID=A0A5J6MWA6_9PROT|nr:hypothetical protein FRZ61_09050 [Hypericibacter adhaerens]
MLRFEPVASAMASCPRFGGGRGVPDAVRPAMLPMLMCLRSENRLLPIELVKGPSTGIGNGLAGAGFLDRRRAL